MVYGPQKLLAVSCWPLFILIQIEYLLFDKFGLISANVGFNANKINAWG
jgi:hypothetical protein